MREAAAFGSAAPQPAPAPGVPPFWRPADGLDCLTLNVWSPDPGAAPRLWDTPPTDTAYPLDDLYRLWRRDLPR